MFTYHVHIKNNVYTSQLYNYFKRGEHEHQINLVLADKREQLWCSQPLPSYRDDNFTKGFFYLLSDGYVPSVSVLSTTTASLSTPATVPLSSLSTSPVDASLS